MSECIILKLFVYFWLCSLLLVSLVFNNYLKWMGLALRIENLSIFDSTFFKTCRLVAELRKRPDKGCLFKCNRTHATVKPLKCCRKKLKRQVGPVTTSAIPIFDTMNVHPKGDWRTLTRLECNSVCSVLRRVLYMNVVIQQDIFSDFWNRLYHMLSKYITIYYFILQCHNAKPCPSCLKKGYCITLYEVQVNFNL